MLEINEHLDDPDIILRSEPFVPVSEDDVENIFEQMVIEVIVLHHDLEDVDDVIRAHFPDNVRHHSGHSIQHLLRRFRVFLMVDLIELTKHFWLQQMQMLVAFLMQPTP